MTVIVMRKDLATLFLEIVLVRKVGMVLMTAHSVSFNFKKFLLWLHDRVHIFRFKKYKLNYYFDNLGLIVDL